MIYREILQRRRDMTEWLIHFTRDSCDVSALEILRAILIEGVLRPGFAARGNPPKKTIYGPSPAVCFSEQPLAGFLQYLAARANSSEMDGYGILIHKHDIYAAGGLPVIYGLGTVKELQPGHPSYDSLCRLLDPSQIGLSEQYRYVAFAPNRTPHPIDWSHEREWRWPSGAASFMKNALALGRIYSSGDKGAFKGRVNVFVRYDSDVTWLQGEIQHAWAKDQMGRISEPGAETYHQHWRDKILDVKVVSLATVKRALQDGQEVFARFEDLPSGALAPLVVDKP